MNYQNQVVLCGASSYSKKFYMNPDFDTLPEDIRQDLKIMCVLFTEDIGGTIELIFNGAGSIEIRTDAAEGDVGYDEIGSVLKVKQLQREQGDLFEKLEAYYRVFALGMDPERLTDPEYLSEFGIDLEDEAEEWER